MAKKTNLTLHHLTSSQSFPVLMALEEASALNPDGLDYNIKIYPRKRVADLKEVFPLGKSPIVVLDPADGSGKQEIMTESRRLLQYISDNFTNGEWIPDTPEDKKRDAFFQEFAKSTHLMKADFCIVYEGPAMFLPFGLRHLVNFLESPVVNYFKNDLKAIHQLMEDELSGEKPWLSGAKLGLADFNAIFGMGMAIQRGYGWDAQKYPKLARWYESMKRRESYKRALEKGGPYDLVNFP